MKMEYVTRRSPLPSCYSFSSRSRDKNPYNPAKKPIAILRENDFPICYFSMCKAIGESQKVDNLTLICALNFSNVKIHIFLELDINYIQKHL